MIVRVASADFGLKKEKGKGDGEKSEQWMRLPDCTRAGALPVLLIWNVYSLSDGQKKDEGFYEELCADIEEECKKIGGKVEAICCPRSDEFISCVAVTFANEEVQKKIQLVVGKQNSQTTLTNTT